MVAEEASIAPLIELLAQAGMTSSTRPDLAWGEPSYMAAAIAPEVDFVMSAIVGVAGLEATYQALRARKRVEMCIRDRSSSSAPAAVRSCLVRSTTVRVTLAASCDSSFGGLDA